MLVPMAWGTITPLAQDTPQVDGVTLPPYGPVNDHYSGLDNLMWGWMPNRRQRRTCPS
jgi:hypothetical protein